jgi:hypothetical protein
MADKNFKVRNGLDIGDSISISDAGVVAGLDTDNLDEGTTNQYFTDARARAAISVSDGGGDGSLSYNNTTGVVTYTGPSASEVRAHFSGGTGVTITDGSVAIGQSVGTGDSPSFAGVSAGNLTVGVATDNTIASTDTNGNIVLDPNGSGQVVLNSGITRVVGEMQANTNLNYVFPAQTLNTVTDNNGYSAASSFPAGTNGYGANASFQHYYGDTLAGTNTAPAFSFRNAAGNSVAGETIPFTGLTSVAPGAIGTGNVMGTLNFSGYATTGFSNDTASQNQGGGLNSLQAMQVQSYATEAFSDAVVTLTSTNVTAVASSFSAPLTTPAVTGTKGQISFSSTTIAVGQAIRVTGTLTGTATGIASGQDYYVIVTNGTTTATLSATPGGSPINTTAGTLTGLTVRRCSVTFTMTGLTNVPFGRGALVTVTGVNNVANGTYPVWGTPTSTSMSIGIPWTFGSTPTVSGSQTFACRTTYQGGGFRIRTFPTATAANLQNRLEMVDITPAATVIRSNTVTFNTGAYGNTGTGLPSGNISYRRTFGCFHKMANVTAAAANTAYAFDWTTSVTAHVNTQGITVSNTSRLNFDSAGNYTAFIEMQVKNTENAARTTWIWLAKNGTDLAETRIKVQIKSGGGADGDMYQLINKQWMLENIAANDYIELKFAVSATTNLSLEYEAAQTTPFVMPAQPSATITIVPVGA